MGDYYEYEEDNFEFNNNDIEMMRDCILFLMMIFLNILDENDTNDENNNFYNNQEDINKDDANNLKNARNLLNTQDISNKSLDLNYMDGINLFSDG